MTRFMLAHLGNGALGDVRILGDSMTRLMHTRAMTHDPRINGFALGFYEQSSHGLRIIGHGGDSQWFHTNMALIPSESLGIFVTMNTDVALVGFRRPAGSSRLSPRTRCAEPSTPGVRVLQLDLAGPR